MRECRGRSRRKAGLFLLWDFLPNASSLTVRYSEPKRLRGLRQPEYRLRVGEVRIFYDVTGTTVQVLAIVTKLEADSWLAQFGNPE
jgi:mRNA-degrading endonuclease RelE of RelBE toxin-antitoxin system